MPAHWWEKNPETGARGVAVILLTLPVSIAAFRSFLYLFQHSTVPFWKDVNQWERSLLLALMITFLVALIWIRVEVKWLVDHRTNQLDFSVIRPNEFARELKKMCAHTQFVYFYNIRFELTDSNWISIWRDDICGNNNLKEVVFLLSQEGLNKFNNVLSSILGEETFNKLKAKSPKRISLEDTKLGPFNCAIFLDGDKKPIFMTTMIRIDEAPARLLKIGQTSPDVMEAMNTLREQYENIVNAVIEARSLTQTS